MNGKLISVIIPCYNAEKYIEACLESITNQTIGIHNMDVIVIDDASTDRSVEYILKYQHRYPEDISLIRLSQNSGQANARNIGMEYVKTDYFAFADADDWLELDMYEKLLAPAKKYKCDLIQCAWLECIDGEEKYNALEIPVKLYEIGGVNEKKSFFSDFGFTKVIGPSLYRTEWVRGNQIHFKHYRKYEDNYWGGLLKYSVETYYPISDFLYHYRIIQNSNSHSRNNEGHFDRLNVELDKLDYYLKKDLFYPYYKEIRNEFLETFYINTLHIICCQFDDIPLEQIEMMQSIVREIYPDYIEYCRESKCFVNPVLTVAFDFPLEIWKRYKDAYCNWGSTGEEEELVSIYTNMRNTLSI